MEYPYDDKAISHDLSDFRGGEKGSLPGSSDFHFDAEKGDNARIPAKGRIGTIMDSFKEMPPTADGKQTDYLARKLKGRHLQMIAIGGAIVRSSPEARCRRARACSNLERTRLTAGLFHS